MIAATHRVMKYNRPIWLFRLQQDACIPLVKPTPRPNTAASAQTIKYNFRFIWTASSMLHSKPIWPALRRPQRAPSTPHWFKEQFKSWNHEHRIKVAVRTEVAGQSENDAWNESIQFLAISNSANKGVHAVVRTGFGVDVHPTLHNLEQPSTNRTRLSKRLMSMDKLSRMYSNYQVKTFNKRSCDDGNSPLRRFLELLGCLRDIRSLLTLSMIEQRDGTPCCWRWADRLIEPWVHRTPVRALVAARTCNHL